MSGLSAIYGGVTRLRRSWYERHPSARRRLSHPVISVGNLTLGGSGKTPVVAALALMLAEMGERPAILSRGYGRRGARREVLVVADGSGVVADVLESGDEPQMLARSLPHVPVLVAANRYAAGVVAEQRFGATVMLLDDGFQHLQLARTVDLLLVSAGDLDDRVLPAGRLREPLSAARRADALLVHALESEVAGIARALGVAPAFTIVPSYRPLRSLGDGAPVPGGARVVAVAGIARPERFFAALRASGVAVVREVAYRDHHWYGARDVAHVAAVARDAAAGVVVTTEKDAVRVEKVLQPGSGPAWAVLPMQVSIEPAGEFRAWLRARL